MSAPVRVLPAPPDGLPMESGPLQVGDDAPGVFVRGDNAAFTAGLLSGAVSGVLDGAPNPAALTLCVHAMRAAELFAVIDLSGRAREMVAAIKERLERATDLADAPAEGSKQ